MDSGDRGDASQQKGKCQGKRENVESMSDGGRKHVYTIDGEEIMAFKFKRALDSYPLVS